MSTAYLEQTEEGKEQFLDYAQIQLPKKIYKLRVLPDTKFQTQNSKGNPMVTLVSEIMLPEEATVKFKGESIKTKIAGIKVTDWIVLIGSQSGKIKAAAKALGVPVFDNEAPDVEGLAGIEYSALCDSQAQDQIDGETNEPIITPDGNKAVVYRTRVLEYYPSPK